MYISTNQACQLISCFIWTIQKPDTATVSNPGPPDNVVAEVLSIAPEIETEQPKPVAKTEQPLSPYTA